MMRNNVQYNYHEFDSLHFKLIPEFKASFLFLLAFLWFGLFFNLLWLFWFFLRLGFCFLLRLLSIFNTFDRQKDWSKKIQTALVFILLWIGLYNCSRMKDFEFCFSITHSAFSGSGAASSSTFSFVCFSLSFFSQLKYPTKQWGENKNVSSKRFRLWVYKAMRSSMSFWTPFQLKHSCYSSSQILLVICLFYCCTQ